MKGKFWILIFCLLCGMQSFSQNSTPLEDETRIKAKEFIISQSSEDFFDNLTELRNIVWNKNIGYLFGDEDIEVIAHTGIHYSINSVEGRIFCHRRKNDKSYSWSSMLSIYFDKNLNVIYSSNIPDIYKGYRLYEENATMSKKDVKKLSKKLSNNKNMKVRDIRYVYLLETDTIFLEVEREKGFKNVYTETQQMDIKNKTLIKTETRPSYRRFPEALSEWFYKLVY